MVFLDEVFLKDFGDHIYLGVDVQFDIDVLEMCVDGKLTDVKLAADMLLTQTAHQQLQDLLFPPGQVVDLSRLGILGEHRQDFGGDRRAHSRSTAY